MPLLLLTNQVFSSIFFKGATVNGKTLFQNWLLFQHENEAHQFIFQQNRASYLSVPICTNGTQINELWSKGSSRQSTSSLPPRNPDLEGKYMVFQPPLPTTIEEIKQEINAAILTVMPEILKRVWEKFEYLVDITQMSGGGHIKNL